MSSDSEPGTQSSAAPAPAPAASATAATPEPAPEGGPTRRSAFVAVAGPDQPGETSSHHGDERRSIQRRLDDAARAAASGAVPSLSIIAVLGFGVVLAIVVALGSGRDWAALTLLIAGIVAALPRMLPVPQRISWRLHAALGGLAVAALMVWPWLQPPGASPRTLWICALMLSVLATAGAAALAPSRRLALPATLLPLSSALCAAQDGAAGESSASMVIGGALFGCVAAAMMLMANRRRWQRLMRGVLERDDRIHALSGERDAAQRADEEKSRFLAIASHDLRQPVHALGLFAATLEKRLQGTREEPLVRNMIRSIDGLDRSFNAMLDVSRLDAGTIEPNVQHFPLRDLFRRLHMHFAGQAELRDLGLRFWPGGKAVSSDPQLLERVLGNLIQNAIKYTAEGGVVVLARSTSTHINIEIWDTGAGIDPAALPRIFDEFYQVGRGEHGRAQGLGMGLAIVKRLCRLLDHRLSVASVPGRGTMFRVGIPFSGLQDIEAATAAADTRPMPISQPRTVLIIDDEEAIREGLRLLLEEWGYEAVTAGSIPEALQVAVQLVVPPDLILSDLHLGDGPDGIAAIAALRKQMGGDVMAVLITGDTSHEEMRRVTESGHPVLFKPVQPRKLYNVVRGLIP